MLRVSSSVPKDLPVEDMIKYRLYVVTKWETGENMIGTVAQRIDNSVLFIGGAMCPMDFLKQQGCRVRVLRKEDKLVW